MKPGKIIKFILLTLLFVLIILTAGIAFLFMDEITIIHSIQKGEGSYPFYMMEYKNGYHLEEMLQNDFRSDEEMSAYLSKLISHGFYSAPEIPESHIGCSTLSCLNHEGRKLWGRNFDWYYSVPIIVKSTPRDGYASLSTCEFTNITGNAEVFPDTLSNQFPAIAAYYVPMDGINEKGLCVAELEINEGGQKPMDTGKRKITQTMAIRLLLDRAATVEEAIALLNQYDVCPSGGISAHLSISDREGNAVAAEFIDNQVVITPTNVVTNFNLHNNDIDAGGESARNRYLILKNALDEAGSVLSLGELRRAMENASQKEGQWKTRWTLVYEDEGEEAGEIRAVYYFDANYTDAHSITLKFR